MKTDPFNPVWLIEVLKDGRPWIVIAAIVSWLWVSGPACWSLRVAHRHRQQGFVESLSDTAIAWYLEQWAPKLTAPQRTREAFSKHLQETVPWGWSTPVAFALLCFVTIAVLAEYAMASVHGVASKSWLSGIAASGLAGGLMWVVADQVDRLRRRDLTQADVASHTLRLLVAVPLGCALSAFGNEAVAGGFAFLLGAFPTKTLFTTAQRIADRNLNLGDSSNNGPHLDLERLQGVGRPEAERFAEEGIRSLLQLAYTDPFVLAVRTNFDFDYVSDLVSQALLWNYVRDDGLPRVQAVGLRGVIEAKHLKDQLGSADPAVKAAAESVLASAVRALNLPPPAMQALNARPPAVQAPNPVPPALQAPDPPPPAAPTITDNVLRGILVELLDDPYAKFICALWDDKD